MRVRHVLIMALTARKAKMNAHWSLYLQNRLSMAFIYLFTKSFVKLFVEHWLCPRLSYRD